MPTKVDFQDPRCWTKRRGGASTADTLESAALGYSRNAISVTILVLYVWRTSCSPCGLYTLPLWNFSLVTLAQQLRLKKQSRYHWVSSALRGVSGGMLAVSLRVDVASSSNSVRSWFIC